jgi:beta-glucanase (GH16 family)
MQRLFAVALLLFACGGTTSVTPPPPVTGSSLAVTPATVALTAGQTQALAAVETLSDGSTKAPSDTTWISSAPGVASVSSAGVVTANGAGSAIVSLAADGMTAAAAVTVNADNATSHTLSSIALQAGPVALAPGQTQQLQVTATYSDASQGALGTGLTWQSSAAGVATVSNSGLVTAVASGSAAVTASSGSLQASVAVQVSLASNAVFVGEYGSHVSFAGADGASNSVTIDSATLSPGGHASLRIAFPASGFTGGSLVASAPRDLSGYDALTFWAKASSAISLGSIGIGDARTTDATVSGLPVGTAWQKFTIPLPLPGKLTQTTSLASFRDASLRAPAVLWIADAQYEKLGLAAPTVTFTGSARSVEAGLTAGVTAADLDVRFTVSSSPVDLTANLSYFIFLSDASSVATVNAAGIITGTGSGTAHITAKLGSVSSSNSLPVNVAAAVYDPGAGWTLVWSDEFDGTAVDPANWNFDLGSGGWGNNESEYYRAENSVVADGKLTITAKIENFGDAPYTSSRLDTSQKQAFTYGKFSMRAKLPGTQAMWPAFWMLGADTNSFSPLYGNGTVSWPGCGEIDIMEMIGGLADGSGDFTTHGTLHYTGASGRDPGPSYAYRYPAKLSNDFHIYELIWTPHSFTWKIDGLAFGTKIMDPDMQALNKPMFLLLNLAIGGAWGGWVDGSTVFPQTYVIDYVRQYTNASITASGAAGLSSVWHLTSGTVSGVTPAGETLQSAAGTISGFQPLKTVSAPAVWYTPVLTGKFEEGAWTLSLFTTSPGTSSVLKAEVFVTAPDGGAAVSLGSVTVDVNATGGGNHRSAFTLVGVPDLQLTNQRLKVVLSPVSGAAAQMVYNGNDFDSSLSLPWSPAQ